MNTDQIMLDPDYRRVFFVHTLTLLGSGILLALLYFSTPDVIPGINKVLGVIILGLCLIPSVIYLERLIKRKAVEPLPLLPLLGLIYGLYYGLPALVQTSPRLNALMPLSHSSLIKPLQLTLVGWLMLLLCFFTSKAILKPIVSPLRLIWDQKKAKKLAVVLIVISITVENINILRLLPASFGQVIVLMSSFFELGIGVFILLDVRNQLNKVQKLLLWVILIPLYLLSQIATGLVSNVLVAIVFIFLLVWAVKRQFNWFMIVSLLLLAILLRSNVQQYRQMVWYGPQAQSNELVRSKLFLELVWLNLTTEQTSALVSAVDVAQNRTAVLNTFAHVVQMTPAVVPYWSGETYYALPTTFIPRVLWPDKPEKTLGQQFGHRYGILDPWDRNTSVNLPQIVEMYANFGWIGVVIGMGILGVIYQMLYLKLNQPGVEDPVILIGAFLFKDLINIESDFTLVFGALIQTGIILYLVLKLSSVRNMNRVACQKTTKSTPMI